MNLVLAFCALVCLPSSHAPTSNRSSAEVPLKAPSGWKTDIQDVATIFTPSDVSAGKFYVVMVTMMQGKAGSLDEILVEAKKVASEIGPFKAAIDPKTDRSDGGWDYKFVLGGIDKGDKSVVVQVMAIKKGDQGGIVLVLSESIETMTQYADSFASMCRAMGGAKVATTAASSNTVDLRYTVPAGWTKQDISGFPLLVKEKNEEYTKYRVSLLILPSEPLSGSIREQFVGYWKDYISPSYTTKIAPIPLMVRLKSGHACAFDADYDAKDKNGNVACVAIYMIAHGGRSVPIMAIYSGLHWNMNNAIENEVAQFLDTATIPSASNAKVQLFQPGSIAGDWSESGTEYATYVTRDGNYAGNATISTAAYFNLKSDGTYARTLMAIGAAGNIREKDSGTWTIDDDELVLNKGGRYSLLGYGADPKVGRFMIIGNYSNTKSRLKFSNPRGILQAMWLKAK